MQFTEFTKIEHFQVPAKKVYSSWLNSNKHSAMTGGEAQIEPKINSNFTAWDGYISGKIIELEEDHLIVMQWRTDEFDEEDEDSLVTIYLTPTEDGCELTLIHQNIPDNQPDYNIGWTDHYFKPMKAYFES
ncbi:MAG: SRPBCC domain-containing protein [Crocinitomicaceae bacterium]